MGTLSSAGFSNTLGVEPSRHCADICRKKGFTIENIYFNQKESLKIEKQYGKAKAVICRHTLEHTTDPHETLISIRQLLSKDSLLVLEVPDARGIINDCVFMSYGTSIYIIIQSTIYLFYYKTLALE